MKLFRHLETSASLSFFGLGLIVFFLSSTRSAGIIDHYKVGDVVHSVLEFNQFTKLHGSGWQLLNGAELKETDDLRKFYASQLIESKNLPDARGMFIRGMNVNRADGKEDPENRKVGQDQQDDFKKHSHSIGGPARVGNIISSQTNFYNESVGRQSNTKTEDTGGAETRPRNITLYVYIKVNEQ